MKSGADEDFIRDYVNFKMCAAGGRLQPQQVQYFVNADMI